MNRFARPLAVLLILLGGLSVSGQSPPDPPSPPWITAPNSITAGTPLVLLATRPEGAVRLRWDVLPPGIAYEVWDHPVSPGGLILIRRPVAGFTYRFGLTALDAAGRPVGSASQEVLIESDPAPPAPGPTPAPQPTPQPTPVPTPDPAPHPVPDGDTLVPDNFPFASFDANGEARGYIQDVSLSFADSLDKAAAAILSGAPMDGARADHLKRWAAARNAAFDRRFQAPLDVLIPPGTANPTIEQRRRYAQFLNRIAAGARGVK